MSLWTIYIVRCSDDSLYTGIARDAVKRVAEHNSGKSSGANYTRGRRPVVLVYQEAAETRSEALKREYAIKQLTREEKEKILRAGSRSGDRGANKSKGRGQKKAVRRKTRD